jgi:hypothetical protein
VSGLTERVARAIEAEYTKAAVASGLFVAAEGSAWEEWTSEARAAQGAVADDVDGLAGVLRGHIFRTAGSEDAYLGVCSHDPHRAQLYSYEEHLTHQAEQLAVYIRDAR